MTNNIKDLRKLNGYSQQELADLVGCARETIANLESGKYCPSLDLADRVALYLNCTIYDLFELYTSCTERDKQQAIRQETVESTLRNVSSLAAKFCD